MRNKTFIIILTVIVAVLCAYYLSFTLQSRRVQKDAEAFATDARGNVDMNKKQTFLDSVWKQPVWNFLGAEYTYQDVRKSELGLGLDLQGGMNVVLEVSPVEIIRVMSGNSKDPKFQEALKRAQELQKNSQDNFVSLFGKAYRDIEPNGNLSRIFANTANKGKISYQSSNDEVLAAINTEVEGAIDRSFNVLRTRIDKFGVNEPKIQRLPGTGRIQIELPGVDNPSRVRKLLQGQAKLEFWEVWKAEEISPFFTQMAEYVTAQEKAGNLKDLTSKTSSEDELTKSAAPKEDALADAAKTDTTDALADAAKADTTDALAESAAKDTNALASQLDKKDTAKATAAAKKDSLDSKSNTLLSKLFTQLPNGLGSNVRDTARV